MKVEFEQSLAVVGADRGEREDAARAVARAVAGQVLGHRESAAAVAVDDLGGVLGIRAEGDASPTAPSVTRLVLVEVTSMKSASSLSTSVSWHSAVTGSPVTSFSSPSASVKAASPAASGTVTVVAPVSTEQESVKANGPKVPAVALVATSFVIRRLVSPYSFVIVARCASGTGADATADSPITSSAPVPDPAAGA